MNSGSELVETDVVVIALLNSGCTIVEKAIKGMLPHNALGRQLFRNLKVYSGSTHPHMAQKPQILKFDSASYVQ